MNDHPGWWWDRAWNPVAGCRPISPGCTNCFAAALAVNYGQYTGAGVTALHPGIVDVVNGRPVFNGILTAAPRGHDIWTEPLRWSGADDPVLGVGEPSLIWTGSMSDIFIEGRDAALITRICATLAQSDHIGLLLMKRTPLMAEYFAALDPRTRARWQPQMWLGFSAERQCEFDARWADMRTLAEAGWTIFVSIAPMLDPVILPDDFLALGSWVIVSGEQGPHRDCRDMEPSWARAIRDQCATNNIAFFMKQMAKKRPIPPDLFIRQFPQLDAAK